MADLRHSQRNMSASPLLGPGMIAWASDWPDWVRVPDQEEPHPVICVGVRLDGMIAILPCSKHGDQGRLQVPIRNKGKPSIASAFKPKGPLSVDPTWVCVADKNWKSNLRWVQVRQGVLTLPKGDIKLRKVTRIKPEEYELLSEHLASALKETINRRR